MDAHGVAGTEAQNPALNKIKVLFLLRNRGRKRRNYLYSLKAKFLRRGYYFIFSTSSPCILSWTHPNQAFIHPYCCTEATLAQVTSDLHNAKSTSQFSDFILTRLPEKFDTVITFLLETLSSFGFQNITLFMIFFLHHYLVLLTFNYWSLFLIFKSWSAPGFSPRTSLFSLFFFVCVGSSLWHVGSVVVVVGARGLFLEARGLLSSCGVRVFSL